MKKKTPPRGPASGGLGDHGDDAVLCLGDVAARDEASREAGLYPELAAYRISEGSSPNVQAKVGRLVGQLPIEQARAELGPRDGLELDEKAIRRIAGTGAQMLPPYRDLLRFRARELPVGERIRRQEGRGRD